MGWPTPGTVLPAPGIHLTGDVADQGLTRAWEGDGMVCMAESWTPQLAQMTFRVNSNVSPIAFTQRVKGRLQHALRQCGTPISFSRKVGMRALGENIGSTVQRYVREQLAHVDLADPRYAQLLADAAIEDAAIDLSQPAETQSGRYWYNLHLVLVTASRYRVGAELHVHAWAATAQAAARASGCAVRALAVMPDHVHMALRGNPEMSPLEIGVMFQNALAKAAGGREWQEKFYVGTFGEYSLRGLGRKAPGELAPPEPKF